MPSTHRPCTAMISLQSTRRPLQTKGVTVKAPLKTFDGRHRSKTGSRQSWRRAALEIDFTDPDVLLAIAGGVVGLALGIGFPVFMVSRDQADEERVEALRELNKETFEATGEYMSKEELAKIRPPRWTDRREFKDDD